MTAANNNNNIIDTHTQNHYIILGVYLPTTRGFHGHAVIEYYNRVKVL